MKSHMINSLFVVASDASLAVLMPEQCELACHYLQVADPDLYELIQQTHRVGFAFECAHEFTHDFQVCALLWWWKKFVLFLW